MSDEDTDQPRGPGRRGVEAIVHLRGDVPIVAQVGGRRVLFVPESADRESIPRAVERLRVTDDDDLAVAEDVPVTVFSPGGAPAVQNKPQDEDDDVPPTPFRPGGVPARIHRDVIMLDLDGLLDTSTEVGARWESTHRRWGAAADVVVPSAEPVTD